MEKAAHRIEQVRYGFHTIIRDNLPRGEHAKFARHGPDVPELVRDFARDRRGL